MIVIRRWKHSRFWAVYDGDRFLCLTVYLKGARAVAQELGCRYPIIDKL